MVLPAIDLFIARLAAIGERARVLLIGDEGRHAAHLAKTAGELVEVDFSQTRERWNDVADRYATESFDGVFASHVLEHMRNPGQALDQMFRVLKSGGVIGIVVPPLKHEIVGGHVTLWNGGLLCYQMILSGFDLSRAAVTQYGYNVAVVATKVAAAIDHSRLCNGDGDIERLAPFFPVPAKQGFDGQITSTRWR